ncbi:MAG: hypothetical protein LUG95_04635 [Clostridiales bacterium]|nr:hypothetical protein [Clostridiales bacterium]
MLDFFGWVESDETKNETVELNGNEFTFYHNGIVRNLQVKNPKIKNNSDNTGVIVGTVAKTARVYGVFVKGEDNSYIKSKGDNVGGIVGDLDAAFLSAAYYAIGDIEFDGDREDAENFGSITGNCNSSETQLLNCFY